ncbi:MAG TPA: efflux transporter outer membrane subunit [Lacunisphaera sp.]|jgi:multidrug efflux system outer membrane protein
MKIHALFLATATTALAAFPSVGPDYQRPSTVSPAAYRDQPADPGNWKTAVPADDLARGEWWQLYADPTLDDLEKRALAANQQLRAAVARLDEARAAAGLARSEYLPSAIIDPSIVRERTSATTDNTFPQTETTTYRGTLSASWEIDLFGRVRRQNESARAEAAASAADLQSVQLALTTEVAANYFSLRGLMSEIVLVGKGVDLRRQTLKLITSRRSLGAATDFDVARAESELASTEAEAAALQNRHSMVKNALAVLVGEAAFGFELADSALVMTEPPRVPAGLPSELLERRPDVAAAERSLAAANARIGVAKAAFFPAISLTGGAGWASGDMDRLFNADSRIWSIGPSLYLPIFQGGRNKANLERSRAAYDEAVAVFRQHVLFAFREVQDALTATRLLAEQSAAQDRALAAARRSDELAQKRYDSGYVNLLEVIDAQRTVLTTERASVQLAAQRLNTSVALIKAVGGAWTLQPRTVAMNP